jgi:hypothetical protein
MLLKEEESCYLVRVGFWKNEIRSQLLWRVARNDRVLHALLLQSDSAMHVLLNARPPQTIKRNDLNWRFCIKMDSDGCMQRIRAWQAREWTPRKHENSSTILQYTERHANARVECSTAFDHCICRFWIRRILMNRATDSQGIESTTRKKYRQDSTYQETTETQECKSTISSILGYNCWLQSTVPTWMKHLCL